MFNLVRYSLLLVLLLSPSVNADIVKHFSFGAANDLGPDKDAGVFIRVEGVGPESNYSNIYYATFDISLATSGDDIDYADVTFNAVEQGGFANWRQEAWATIAWAPIKYRRDTAIGLESMFSIGVLDVGAGHIMMENKDFKVFLEGAAELLSYGISKSTSGAEAEGLFTGLLGQIAAEGAKFRIALGGELRHVYGSESKTGTKYNCCEHDGELICEPYDVKSRDTQTWAELFLETRFGINEKWQGFARASLNFFEVEEAGDKSDEDELRFIFGATYTGDPGDSDITDRPWARLR